MLNRPQRGGRRGWWWVGFEEGGERSDRARGDVRVGASLHRDREVRSRLMMGFTIPSHHGARIRHHGARIRRARTGFRAKGY